MCPSYMVTREEHHATRGRARLLFEILQGDPLDRGWDSEHVHEALDLCLSCKGCKGECPVHVDMATYKAEFLSHYYEHQWRPRSAYAFGLIHVGGTGIASAARDQCADAVAWIESHREVRYRNAARALHSTVCAVHVP